MTFFRSCSFLFLAITLVALHANAREIPQTKNTINNQKKEVVVEVTSPKNSPTNTKIGNDNNVTNPTKDLAKGDKVNVVDEKNFIKFAGVGAAGGIGGVAGVMPIGFIGKGFPTFGGLGGGGLGGAGGAGGLGGLGGLGGGGLGCGGLGGNSASVTP